MSIKKYSYEEADFLLNDLTEFKKSIKNDLSWSVGIISEKHIKNIKQNYSHSFFASGEFDLLYDCKDILIRRYHFSDYNLEPINDVDLSIYVNYRIMFIGFKIGKEGFLD